MDTRNKPIELEHVACDVCLKEIPWSQAIVPESTDYVVHFCGLAFYAEWKSQQQATLDEPAA